MQAAKHFPAACDRHAQACMAAVGVATHAKVDQPSHEALAVIGCHDTHALRRPGVRQAAGGWQPHPPRPRGVAELLAAPTPLCSAGCMPVGRSLSCTYALANGGMSWQHSCVGQWRQAVPVQTPVLVHEWAIACQPGLLLWGCRPSCQHARAKWAACSHCRGL
jgi:hypothetical protein